MPQSELLPKFVRPVRNPRASEHPLIAIAKKQLKAGTLCGHDANYWYICKLGDGLEFFIGEVTEPLKPDIVGGLIRKPNFLRRGIASVRTPLGETVEAAIYGAINKPRITEGQKRVIACFINPQREVIADVHPEIFTFASTFNYVKRDWPMINSPEHINALSSADKENLLDDLLSAGLGVLDWESENIHMQTAAKRFRLLIQSPFLRFHITSDIYAALRQEKKIPGERLKSFAPEPHSLVYLPNFDHNTPGMGEVMVPTAWMWAAYKTPIPAFCSLIYASSLIRDDYYSKLRGSAVYAPRYFGSVEVPKKLTALMRAEALVAELIREVYVYDHKIYLLDPHHDGFMKKVSKKYPEGTKHISDLYYLDPPDRQKGRINQNV